MTTKEKFAKALILAQTLINFGKQAPAVVEEAKFEAFKIKDSDAVIEYSLLEVGAEVKQSSASGSVPALDGVYNLESGVVITSKDGKIEKFEEPAKAAEPTQAEKDAAAAKTIEDKMSAAYEARYTAIETAFNSLKTQVETAVLALAKVPTVAQIEAFNKVAEEFKGHAVAIGEGITLLAKIPVEFSKRETEKVPVQEAEKVNETYSAIAEYFSKKAEQAAE